MAIRSSPAPSSRPAGSASQKQRQRGRKLYSWHAPEVECIAKGKAAKPYEFGVKVSITTTNKRCKGGQFIFHATAPPTNPFDGHTLKGVIEETEALTGREVERIYVDKGYRGHDVPRPIRAFKSVQKRSVHGQIKKELRRRSAIEAVIGHNKTDGQLGRNFLKGHLEDHINAVMSAVGYNFRLLLVWMKLLLRLIIADIIATLIPMAAFKDSSSSLRRILFADLAARFKDWWCIPIR